MASSSSFSLSVSSSFSFADKAALEQHLPPALIDLLESSKMCTVAYKKPSFSNFYFSNRIVAQISKEAVTLHVYLFLKNFTKLFEVFQYPWSEGNCKSPIYKIYLKNEKSSLQPQIVDAIFTSVLRLQIKHPSIHPQAIIPFALLEQTKDKELPLDPALFDMDNVSLKAQAFLRSTIDSSLILTESRIRTMEKHLPHELIQLFQYSCPLPINYVEEALNEVNYTQTVIAVESDQNPRFIDTYFFHYQTSILDQFWIKWKDGVAIQDSHSTNFDFYFTEPAALSKELKNQIYIKAIQLYFLTEDEQKTALNRHIRKAILQLTTTGELDKDLIKQSPIMKQNSPKRRSHI